MNLSPALSSFESAYGKPGTPGRDQCRTLVAEDSQDTQSKSASNGRVHMEAGLAHNFVEIS